jgi:hypothetical protein
MLWFCILITRPWLVDVSRIKDNLEIKRMFVLPEVRGRVKVFEMNNGVRVFLFSFGTQIGGDGSYWYVSEMWIYSN